MREKEMEKGNDDDGGDGGSNGLSRCAMFSTACSIYFALFALP